MLCSVERCSAPSALFRTCITCAKAFSASLYLPSLRAHISQISKAIPSSCFLHLLTLTLERIMYAVDTSSTRSYLCGRCPVTPPLVVLELWLPTLQKRPPFVASSSLQDVFCRVCKGDSLPCLNSRGFFFVRPVDVNQHCKIHPNHMESWLATLRLLVRLRLRRLGAELLP